ncbi:DUF2085 domain-containing protein [Hazenella coriacea]|uniref:Putative membrane protein n=1 Tax=Hazenella coriacea TaxID=1179467 RepID=A0A4R3L801_9BACL|nr:DUF2085 domain-containing protein [Hazenella coriacea]TCS95769.1 putative membrane protein [Hazenella coriacea]
MPLLKNLILMIPCHRKPNRCLHMKGKPLPICARCMSMLLGYLWIPILFLVPIELPWWVGVPLQLPMLIDGFTQLFKWRESTNLLRVITGSLSGLGLSIIIVDLSIKLASWLSSW